MDEVEAGAEDGECVPDADPLCDKEDEQRVEADEKEVQQAQRQKWITGVRKDRRHVGI